MINTTPIVAMFTEKTERKLGWRNVFSVARSSNAVGRAAAAIHAVNAA